MEKSRLIALLQTLSNKECRNVQLFLRSPFHNKREEVSQLFDYLLPYLSENQRIPSKQIAYQALATGAYDDQQMRLWMSFLLKSVEKYLLQADFFADEVQTKIRLSQIYRQRNLPKQVDRSLREVETLQQKQIYRNAAFYQNDFQFQLEQYRVSSANQRTIELNLQKMSDNIDLAFLAQKLRQACLIISHQAVYKKDYDIGLLEETLQYVEARELQEVPAVAVYYYAYRTLSQPERPAYFSFFKNALVSHSDKFPQEELGDLYILAINFCIKKYNAGERAFLADEFELYKVGLGKDLFSINKHLSRYTYRNVVTIGLVLGEFDWVEKFIHQYKNALEKTHRISTFSLSLAGLKYSRKNYDEALVLLRNSNFKEVLLNLAAKTIMLKIYYELDEYDLLDAHLVAMRTFIRRKKIIAYHQENYINLIHFTRKLIERNPYDKTETQKLKSEMEITKVVAEKEWLLGQV